MFKYLIAFVLFAPFAGIVMMEGGEYGGSVAQTGFPNGASVAYACYAVIVVLIAWLIGRGSPGKSRQEILHVIGWTRAESHYHAIAIGLLLVSFSVLIVMLFGYGGIQVISGSVGKGEFRANLGPLGAIAYVLIKVVEPALLAYCTLLYMECARTRFNRFLWFANCLVAFTVGLTWGFKATGLFLLLPSLVLRYWHMRLRQLVPIVLMVFAVLLALYYLFDAESEGYSDAIGFLWRRVTVLQGDVAWAIWDKHANGDEFPAYLRTLLPVTGDKIFTILTGIDQSNYSEWIDYHYDLLLNSLAGVSVDQMLDGYSITGTPFSEGVVAGGVIGLATFAAIAGVLVGVSFRTIQFARQRGDHIVAAVVASYFANSIFPWLYGGGIIQLVHIVAVLGYVVMYILLNASRPLILARLTPIDRQLLLHESTLAKPDP